MLSVAGTYHSERGHRPADYTARIPEIRGKRYGAYRALGADRSTRHGGIRPAQSVGQFAICARIWVYSRTVGLFEAEVTK